MTTQNKHTPEWDYGDIVESRDGKTTVKFHAFNAPGYQLPDGCFEGTNLADGDASVFWLIKNFRIKTKYHKGLRGYYITAAVHKFLKRKRITQEQAIGILNKKAKLSIQLSKGAVEMWVKYSLNAPKFYEATGREVA